MRRRRICAAKGETARAIDEKGRRGEPAETAAHRAEPIDARRILRRARDDACDAERGVVAKSIPRHAGSAAGALNAGSLHVDFEARDEARIELDIIADLPAADEAPLLHPGHAGAGARRGARSREGGVRSAGELVVEVVGPPIAHPARGRGHGAGRAPAVAGVQTRIEARPYRRCFDRRVLAGVKIGGACRAGAERHESRGAEAEFLHQSLLVKRPRRSRRSGCLFNLSYKMLHNSKRF